MNATPPEGKTRSAQKLNTASAPEPRPLRCPRADAHKPNNGARRVPNAYPLRRAAASGPGHVALGCTWSHAVYSSLPAGAASSSSCHPTNGRPRARAKRNVCALPQRVCIVHQSDGPRRALSGLPRNGRRCRCRCCCCCCYYHYYHLSLSSFIIIYHHLSLLLETVRGTPIGRTLACSERSAAYSASRRSTFRRGGACRST